jgi:hypothetical protein
MVRKEELGPVVKVQLNNFQGLDYIGQTNAAWAFLRDNCKEQRGIDGGFRYLCSDKRNTSKVPQERNCRRCALPWCPHGTVVNQVVAGRACWLPIKKN